jgi:hypothetical protein
MGTVFAGARAPSTPGSHLRSYTWGNVRQPGKAHRGFLAALAGDGRLPGREALTFVDIDSTQKRVFGYQKEGAAFGHAKIAGVGAGAISSRPSRSAISSTCPAVSPRASRRALGTTTRPAPSMAVLMPAIYHLSRRSPRSGVPARPSGRRSRPLASAPPDSADSGPELSRRAPGTVFVLPDDVGHVDDPCRGNCHKGNLPRVVLIVERRRQFVSMVSLPIEPMSADNPVMAADLAVFL